MVVRRVRERTGRAITRLSFRGVKFGEAWGLGDEEGEVAADDVLFGEVGFVDVAVGMTVALGVVLTSGVDELLVGGGGASNVVVEVVEMEEVDISELVLAERTEEDVRDVVAITVGEDEDGSEFRMLDNIDDKGTVCGLVPVLVAAAERAGVEAAAPPLLVGAAESAVMIWAWRRSVASTSINIVKVARPWLGKRRNQEVGNSTLED
ncbi:hypothetical protein L207DRAFT_517053 [Hyaloscypha variabilis F]|uniref:Uncharacterized protein n=1 Tax=Hyaloscypha variabilis (strain UAMH 11265 / GT02V1 / F) TaxID=1149755 RepID=A0A2J6R8S9_HYAVF|nr:hypothetical protein L207DRAFT_517053 [Hyaloscypha variabilis F]